MNAFRQAYDGLPDADKDRVMELLHGCFKWGGWDRVRVCDPAAGIAPHCLVAVEEMVEVFSRNGREFAGYT